MSQKFHVFGAFRNDGNHCEIKLRKVINLSILSGTQVMVKHQNFSLPRNINNFDCTTFDVSRLNTFKMCQNYFYNPIGYDEKPRRCCFGVPPPVSNDHSGRIIYSKKNTLALLQLHIFTWKIRPWQYHRNFSSCSNPSPIQQGIIVIFVVSYLIVFQGTYGEFIYSLFKNSEQVATFFTPLSHYMAAQLDCSGQLSEAQHTWAIDHMFLWFIGW